MQVANFWKHITAAALCAAAALVPLGPASAQSTGSIRALHFLPGGVARTQNVSGVALTGDLTFRVLLKRNEWDLVSHNFICLTDAGGNVRLSLGVNTSPWVVAFVSNNGAFAGANKYGVDDAVRYGAPSGTTYEDWWAVYKAPTSSAAGYLRIYHSGALAPDSNGADYNIQIPAGTSMTWKGGPLQLQLGDDFSVGTRQDYTMMDICWWTTAFTSAEVAAIGSRQLSSITDDAVRKTSSLYWYARPGNADADGVRPELGVAAGDPNWKALFSGNVTYSTDTPRDSSWEQPDDVTPPDPGDTPLSATATDTTVIVTEQPGSADTAARDLILSKGEVWRYSPVAQQAVSPPGEAFEKIYTGLAPGTTYFVTGHWADADGNTAERQIPVTTTGSEQPTTGPTRSLRIIGAGELSTVTDTTGATGVFHEMPYNCDATVRLFARGNNANAGPAWIFSQRADYTGTFGYQRFAIGLDNHNNVFAQVSDGHQTFAANSGEPLSTTDFDEIWLVYVTPTATTDGSIAIYKNLILMDSEPIPAGTDMTWKKWDAQFVLGGLYFGIPNSDIDYNITDIAWWTKALSDTERAAISGQPLFACATEDQLRPDLYWYARPHPSTDDVTPDLGVSIDTTPTRQSNIQVLEPGVIAPKVTSSYASLVSWSTDIPTSFGSAGDGEPMQLGFGIQPADAAPNAPFLTQPVVVVLDDSGLPVSTYTGPVTVAIAPNTGAPGASLTGSTTVNAVDGVATFTNLAISKPGQDYVLTVTAGSLDTGQSDSFDVEPIPFSFTDVVRALKVAGGLAPATTVDTARLSILDGAGTPGVVTIVNAVDIARKAVGLGAGL